jgi:heavy metal translocating P-type ATPase
VAAVTAIVAAILGGMDSVRDMIESIRQKQFALDYIALLAIIVGLFTGHYVVVALIALMLSGGKTLEQYGMLEAKKSLTQLIDRIPKDVFLAKNGAPGEKIAIADAKIGQEILIRKGEVIPLDGILVSATALTDESSLTGEPYMIDKLQGDELRSGTINAGNPIVLKVTKVDADSTYRKIIEMVKQAQVDKPKFLRMADKYSTVFTLITFTIVLLTYFATGSIERVLAVLVIATPCPLILAAPVALFGGMNAAAKRRVLLKKLSSIEVLSRVTDIIFDKTGTITLGVPKVSSVEVIEKKMELPFVYSVAEAIERHSLHPLAKAIVGQARITGAHVIQAAEVREIVGSGISGVVDGVRYSLEKSHGENAQMAIDMRRETDLVARFLFDDELKDDSVKILRRLLLGGVSLSIFTGDKEANTQRLVARLGSIGSQVTVQANCTPEDKKNGILRLKEKGKVVAMVGDGINDAPALAMADVGMVFSHEEQTAASDAADVVFLGGDMALVSHVLGIAQRTMRIAKQSIFTGIGLSIGGMILASVGLIPPAAGALLQEGIDVLVILNALRASR